MVIATFTDLRINVAAVTKSGRTKAAGFGFVGIKGLGLRLKHSLFVRFELDGIVVRFASWSVRFKER